MKAVDGKEPAAHFGISGFYFIRRLHPFPYPVNDGLQMMIRAVELVRDGYYQGDLFDSFWINYHNKLIYPFSNEDLFVVVQKKALDGDVEAQLCLARMFWFGQGTSRNTEEAYKWIFISAQNGSSTAQYILYRRDSLIGRKYSHLANGRKRDYWLKQMEQSDVLYYKYLSLRGDPYGIKEMADQGYAWAQYKYALHLHRNTNVRAAYDYIREVFNENSDEYAEMRILFTIYQILNETEMDTIQNGIETIKQYLENQKSYDYLLIKNVLFTVNIVCEEDLIKLKDIFLHSTNSEDIYTQLLLGICYEELRNKEDAAKHYRLAVREGYGIAAYCLGNLIKKEYEQDIASVSIITESPKKNFKHIEPELRNRGNNLYEAILCNSFAYHNGYKTASASIFQMLNSIFLEDPYIRTEWLDKYTNDKMWSENYFFDSEDSSNLYYCYHLSILCPFENFRNCPDFDIFEITVLCDN